MKNLNIKKILLLSTTLLIGCVNDDDLFQVDPNVNTEASFWQNDGDGLKGINAVYQTLLYEGTYMRSTPLLLDVRGDDARSQSPWEAMYRAARFNVSIADESIYGWAYREYYIGINRANQVLEHVPNIAFEDNELKNRILGQAYFLRGLYLFHAVNLFGNVPIPTANDRIYHEQKTVEEGWEQVIADFTVAAELLPLSYNSVQGLDKDDIGRATKGAALAYLGKAYLFTHDYVNARNRFKEVIDLGIYSLVSNYGDNFTEVNENNSESIFEVQFTRDLGGVDLGWVGAPGPGWGKTSARAITYGPPNFGFNDVQPTWALFNDYQIEPTINGEVDPRLDITILYNKPGGMRMYLTDFATAYAANTALLNDIYCNKYQNSGSGRADEYDWRSGINERIMRYADVLLMYAETLNETGATADAYPYIQMVRSRVNLPDLATTKPTMTQAQMREQIAHERFLEFPLEGHRFDDIRRWGWLSDSAKLDWLKSRDPEFEFYMPGREYFPIPQAEIDNNQGIKQNPSY